MEWNDFVLWKIPRTWDVDMDGVLCTRSLCRAVLCGADTSAGQTSRLLQTSPHLTSPYLRSATLTDQIRKSETKQTPNQHNTETSPIHPIPVPCFRTYTYTTLPNRRATTHLLQVLVPKRNYPTLGLLRECAVRSGQRTNTASRVMRCMYVCMEPADSNSDKMTIKVITLGLVGWKKRCGCVCSDKTE